MIKETVAVGIPVYLTDPAHAEFLQKTLDSIPPTVPVFYWLNAWDEGMKLPWPGNVKVLNTKPENVGVAGAWNRLINHILDDVADYALIMNSDLILAPGAIDHLVEFAKDNPDFAVWTAAEWDSARTIYQAAPGTDFDLHPNMSCFLINHNGTDRLAACPLEDDEDYPGMFDEGYVGAYMEDIDYHYRLKRAGLEAAKTTRAWFYHFRSTTIRCDSELRLRNEATFARNKERFRNKFGLEGDGLAL